MCVIAIYKDGNRPEASDIEKMMEHNPDGAGLAWNDGKEVFFRKGFKTAEEVMRIANLIPKNAPHIIFHARIATSGGVSAEKCHPFVISNKNDMLNLTAGRGSSPILFHNGVFSIDVEKGLNDTQTMIKNGVAPLVALAPKKACKGDFDFIFSKLFSGSRVVIMYPDRLLCYGDWQKDGGNLYSNLNHKRTYSWYNWRNDAWNNYSNYYSNSNSNSNSTPKTAPVAVMRWVSGDWYINNYKVERGNLRGANYYDGVCERVEKANRFGTPPWRNACAYANGTPIKWDGKENEAEYDKRVDELTKKQTAKKQGKLLSVKGVKIPRHHYESEHAYNIRIDTYKKRAENGIPPTFANAITYNNLTYLWNGKETPHEYLRRVLAEIRGEAYKPLKQPKFKLTYCKSRDLFAINDGAPITKFKDEDTAAYYTRVKSYIDIANFTGGHYSCSASANNIPVLWDGVMTYAELSAHAAKLSRSGYPLAPLALAPAYENNHGATEEVKS